MTEIFREAPRPETGRGMVVDEALAGEARIPLPGAPVVAFVAPAPRGPADAPVAIASGAEFQRRFGSPAERSRLELVLGQFFANGGGTAVVVRVPRSRGAAALRLPGPGGDLELRAVNPGPREYLRAAVDYDRIHPDDLWRFNLTVQRVRSPANPLVEEQEIYAGVSVDPGDPACVGAVLRASALVRAGGEPPAVRPAATAEAGSGATRGYVVAGTPDDAGGVPSDYDLVGSPTDCTGLHALDLLPRVDAVVLLPPAGDRDLGPVALYAAERYCRRRHALLLVDPPLAWLEGGPAAVGAQPLPVAGAGVVTCFPRLVGPDQRPQLSALGLLAAWLTVAADAAPAPLLRSAWPVATALSAEDAALLARRGVNALLPAAGGLRLAGGVTLAQPGRDRPEWRDLALRLRVLRIVDTLARATRWTLVQPRGPALWGAVQAQVGRFLADTVAAGWLPATPDGPAWYVRCDTDTHARGASPAFVVGLRCGAGYAAFRFVHGFEGCRVSEVVWQPGTSLAN